jgi:hypothetical protein
MLRRLLLRQVRQGSLENKQTASVMGVRFALKSFFAASLMSPTKPPNQGIRLHLLNTRIVLQFRFVTRSWSPIFSVAWPNSIVAQCL